MSFVIIKGDGLTSAGGGGRSRSYNADFPTLWLECVGRLAQRDGVFSDEKEDSLSWNFLPSALWWRCLEGLCFISFKVSEQNK